MWSFLRKNFIDVALNRPAGGIFLFSLSTQRMNKDISMGKGLKE
jgi:hypothetical protein